MIAVGIDIGSTTTKVALLDDDALRASLVRPSGNLPAETARAIFAEALAESGVSDDAVDVIATTGYGRRLADFGDVVMTEIKACATGVRFARPDDDVRTVIDVGGQDTKVIALTEDGDVEDFGMNDKCAAGTGRFLEMLAHKLEIPYEQCVEEALRAEEEIHMNATCAVFAESEVVGLLARGVERPDIAAAAHAAIANRIAGMVRRVSVGGAYCFVGGGARNRALVRAMEEHLGEPLIVPENAQVMVALGAAVGGRDRLRKRAAREEADA